MKNVVNNAFAKRIILKSIISLLSIVILGGCACRETSTILDDVEKYYNNRNFFDQYDLSWFENYSSYLTKKEKGHILKILTSKDKVYKDTTIYVFEQNGILYAVAVYDKKNSSSAYESSYKYSYMFFKKEKGEQWQLVRLGGGSNYSNVFY